MKCPAAYLAAEISCVSVSVTRTQEASKYIYFESLRPTTLVSIGLSTRMSLRIVENMNQDQNLTQGFVTEIYCRFFTLFILAI